MSVSTNLALSCDEDYFHLFIISFASILLTSIMPQQLMCVTVATSTDEPRVRILATRIADDEEQYVFCNTHDSQ